MIIRPRRLRSNPVLRRMARETRCDASQLIYPVFVREGQNVAEPIESMPGQTRYSPDTVKMAAEAALEAGVSALLLFGLPGEKDEIGSGAWAEDGVVQRALKALRGYEELLLVTDLCLCEYTSHGHCGVLDGGKVDNDSTLPLLAKAALSHAQAGADIVAPSDMMDGRVLAIREALEYGGFTDTAIMAYSVKYASAFYGPFRDAAGSAPMFGDRKGYQMPPPNAREALRELRLDIEEGADIVMVKPALPYLDVLRDVAAESEVPVAAYMVSGEYAMLECAAKLGALERTGAICEAALGVFRAGADILISYHAIELAKWMKEGRL